MCEAEDIAENATCLETMWLRKVMKEFGHLSPLPTVIKCDNKAALALLLNTDAHPSRVKHIDNRHHQYREETERGRFTNEYCASASILADCLTEPLPRAALECQWMVMGLGPVL